MKKLFPAAVAALALLVAPTAMGSASKHCKAFKGTSHQAGCVKAITAAVDQLNAANGDIAAINPAKACAAMSKKKAKGVKGGTPFALCVKVIKDFKASIPPNPGPPPSR